MRKTKDLLYRLQEHFRIFSSRLYVSTCLINVFTLIPETLFGYMAYHILARPKRTRLPVKHSVARYTSAFM